MTAEWEKQLAEVQQGKLSDIIFMEGITKFLTEYIGTVKNTPPKADDTEVFSAGKQPVGICPACGKNIIETPKAYSCISGRNGCGFVIWKTISEKKISIAQAKRLLEKGGTDIIKGFTSKAGKPFDAKLILTEKNGIKQVSFEFAGRAQATGGM